METIKIRRSIRSYQDKPVDKETIDLLLRAAMQAPSAANHQPWEFIVVQDKKSLDQLANMSPYAKMVANAPLTIVMLGNKEKMKYPQMWQQDLGAAAENLLLEAVDQGLGAVWLGVAPFEDRMQFIKDMFQLKESLMPFCVIPIGYPEGQGNIFIDRYDPSAVHYEKY